MVFTFNFIQFAEEIAGSYLIKDVWGIERDIRDAELILTESQLKLWNCYNSWEDYYQNCIENHYTFRVAKTAPYLEDMDDIRQLNYQFIQPLSLSDVDIDALIIPTINEIRGIIGLDYRKSLVYMCGKGLDENTVQYADPICRALMIDPGIIDDPYLRNRIRKMIDKRIRDAKIGVLDVHGNFQILSGDLYALCEHIFGLEVHGLLKAGEIYSYYWIKNGAEKIFCARAPMSNEHSLVSQYLNNGLEALKWFKYMDSVVVVNAWDTMSQALNGFDYDGDLLFTTNNKVLLNNQHNLPALNCIQYKAKKCIVTEEELINSNKKGFGSKIGAITNRITEMTAMMAKFPRDSQEYKILKYRTQCGQNYQQNEIDAAKGIISNPMPSSWYVWKENQIKDDDTDEIKARKQLYQRICAHKKPYFFQYNYTYLRTDYLQYTKQAKENCQSLFNKNLSALLCGTTFTEDEQKFIDTYNHKMNVDFAPSTMNRICWAVEKIFDGVDFFKDVYFDYTILKSNIVYSLQDYSTIKGLCQNYQTDYLNTITNNAVQQFECDGDGEYDVNQLLMILKQKIDETVPNEVIQCEILLDLCYRDGFNKQIVWTLCGDVIVQTLLQSHDNLIKYPKKCENGAFMCCGNTFSMQKLIVGGENDEEF